MYGLYFAITDSFTGDLLPPAADRERRDAATCWPPQVDRALRPCTGREV